MISIIASRQRTVELPGKDYLMQKLSEITGIDRGSLIKILNLMPYPFLLSEYINNVQRNIFVNNRFILEFGYTCDDIPTINDWFLKAYPDPAYRLEVISNWRADVGKARDAGVDSAVQQAKIQTRNFGARWYEIRASVLGAVNFVAFINIDQEIRHEQELELLNENKNRTLSILAHDLRSPLNNLHAVLELVARNALTESERNILFKKLGHQVFQMTEFMETTLQWSKVNFTKTTAVYVPVSVRPVVEKLIQLYQYGIESKSLQVDLHLNPRVQPWVDAEILSIVIRNLLSNAIKYTPVGGRIKVYDQLSDNQYQLSVENTGKGLSEEKIIMILDRSLYSEQGTQGEKGLGLGLRLCQQLLDNIHGKLQIKCAKDQHTTFTLVLPYTPREEYSLKPTPE